jgi:hypothetical protein
VAGGADAALVAGIAVLAGDLDSASAGVGAGAAGSVGGGPDGVSGDQHGVGTRSGIPTGMAGDLAGIITRITVIPRPITT